MRFTKIFTLVFSIIWAGAFMISTYVGFLGAALVCSAFCFANLATYNILTSHYK